MWSSFHFLKIIWTSFKSFHLKIIPFKNKTQKSFCQSSHTKLWLMKDPQPIFRSQYLILELYFYFLIKCFNLFSFLIGQFPPLTPSLLNYILGFKIASKLKSLKNSPSALKVGCSSLFQALRWATPLWQGRMSNWLCNVGPSFCPFTDVH